MRRAAKTDDNQGAIVNGLRKLGISVQSLATIGTGCPDICVGYAGRNWLFELKDPTNSPSEQQLNPKQVEWHECWRGQVGTVCHMEQILTVIEQDLQRLRIQHVTPEILEVIRNWSPPINSKRRQNSSIP